jgi:starvation-inducible DNA-binding protein
MAERKLWLRGDQIRPLIPNRGGCIASDCITVDGRLVGYMYHVVVGLLNARLADCTDLQTQTKQAHWNVKGPNVIALHELFDKINEDVEDYVDDIAERAVQLGGVAEGTARMVAKRSSLAEYPANAADDRSHVEALPSALAAFGKAAGKALGEANELGDLDTADLFTAVSRGLDKWLWFVEAHLQAER